MLQVFAPPGYFNHVNGSVFIGVKQLYPHMKLGLLLETRVPLSS